MQTLKFESKITKFENLNPLFSKIKIRIAYTGLNRNNSYISKEAFESALPSIFHCPIIGEFNESIDDFRGHGGKIEISDEGIKWIQTTQPYGVIDNDTEISWEDVTEEDGTVKSYLCATGYLWTGRYPELLQVIENSKSQSMEIEIVSGEYSTIDDTKCYCINSFIFSGFCILGNDVEPCFESSEVMAYSHDKFKFDFNQMLKELKFSLEETFADASTGEKIEIDNTKESANMTGAWSSVNKSALRKKIVGASNAASLVKEAYLVVDNSWEDSPSESLHYPHHVIKNGKLIVHKAGLEAAYARLMQNDPNNTKALNHVKKHYRELDLDMSSFQKEGGKVEVPENVLSLLQKYSLTAEDLVSREIKYEDYSIEDLEAKVQEVFNKEPNTTFALTSEQLEDELRRELGEIETLSDPYWTEYKYPRYCYVDNKLDTNIVIAWDCKNSYLVGGTFVVQNDNVEVDDNSLVRYKIDYNPMNLSGDPDPDDQDNMTMIPNDVLDYKLKIKEFELNKQFEIDKQSAIADAQSAFGELQKDFAELQQKYATLESKANEFESELFAKVQKERQDAESQIFESFAVELTEEEMKPVRDKASEMSLEDITDKLFSIAGRKKVQFSFQQSKDSPLGFKIPTDNKKITGKAYDDLFDKFNKKEDE